MTHRQELLADCPPKHVAAGEVDVASAFGDAGLYPFWATDPLAVSWHPARFARCGMAAAMLSNDQACVAPMRRMQVRQQGVDLRVKGTDVGGIARGGIQAVALIPDAWLLTQFDNLIACAGAGGGHACVPGVCAPVRGVRAGRGWVEGVPGPV